jgi:hypothetical protein
MLEKAGMLLLYRFIGINSSLWREQYFLLANLLKNAPKILLRYNIKIFFLPT